MTGKEKILSVLQDGRWHSFSELLEAYYKYTQRIFDLRRAGYVIEERSNEHNKHASDYRLVKEAKEERKPKGLTIEEKAAIARQTVHVVRPEPKREPDLFGFAA